MAGLTGRMSTVVKAKVSKLLDRAEDPAETLDYSYQKQVEQLQNVKKGIADVVTAKKRLQMQESTLQQSVVKLDTQARQALAAGKEDLAQDGARTQERRPDRAAGARHAGRRTRRPAAEADRLRAETAREDRSVPHQEGGHQGAVLGRRGPGADLRGGHRRRRADGRRGAGDAARGRQDRKHEGARRRRIGARSRRHVRRHHPARLRRRRHRPPAQAALQPARGRRRAGEDEERTRRAAPPRRRSRRPPTPARRRRADGGADPGQQPSESAARHDRPHLRRGPVPARRQRRGSAWTSCEARRCRSSTAATRSGFADAFAALLDYVRTHGTPLGDDELEGSDVILPPADFSFEEAGASSPARA